jgi:4a-hydroxytetrahydrobiopterin dehydratase
VGLARRSLAVAGIRSRRHIRRIGGSMPAGRGTMTELAAKTCVPCRGGVPPMARTEAERYLREAPGWALRDEDTRIERTFKLKNFKEALVLVNRIGALAEDEGHHPEITFGWGYVTVSLHTHKIKGLHENDFIMAAKINRLAEA